VITVICSIIDEDIMQFVTVVVVRPTVAGIHPGPEGAYSIALSGGYEDDIDLGECFTYTGEGTLLAFILILFSIIVNVCFAQYRYY